MRLSDVLLHLLNAFYEVFDLGNIHQERLHRVQRRDHPAESERPRTALGEHQRLRSSCNINDENKILEQSWPTIHAA